MEWCTERCISMDGISHTHTHTHSLSLCVSSIFSYVRCEATCSREGCFQLLAPNHTPCVSLPVHLSPSWAPRDGRRSSPLKHHPQGQVVALWRTAGLWLGTAQTKAPARISKKNTISNMYTFTHTYMCTYTHTHTHTHTCMHACIHTYIHR